MLLRYLLLNWLFSSDSVNERGRQFGLFLAVAFLTGCTTTVRTTNAIDFSQFHDKKAELTSKPADVEVAQQDPTELLNKADSYRKMGKMDDALYAYVQVLETQPENVAVLVAIADIHHGKSNYDLAEVAYRMALKSVPHNVDALEGLGLVLMHKHVYGEAEKTLKLAVQENSHRWRSHNALGLLADMNGNHDVALSHFQRALSEHSDNAQVLTNMGYSRYLAGDRSGALLSLDEALKVDPHNEAAWLNKGLVLARQGKEKEALEAFRNVLDEADSCNNLGYIYMMDGENNKAREMFERAIYLSPTYHEKANQNLRRLNAGVN